MGSEGMRWGGEWRRWGQGGGEEGSENRGGWVPSTHFTIDGEKLVPPANGALLVSITSRDDSGNVDWTLLLLPSHHIEAKPFRSLHRRTNPPLTLSFPKRTIL